jgi:hypothetical protein
MTWAKIVGKKQHSEGDIVVPLKITKQKWGKEPECLLYAYL